MLAYWTPKNLMHIAEHDVEPYEAMYVLEHPKPPYPREVGNGKLQVWGKTESGRFLQVIYMFPDDEDIDISYLEPLDRLDFLAGDEELVYVVHARDLTNNERRTFRRLMRGHS